MQIPKTVRNIFSNVPSLSPHPIYVRLEAVVLLQYQQEYVNFGFGIISTVPFRPEEPDVNLQRERMMQRVSAGGGLVKGHADDGRTSIDWTSQQLNY